MATKLSITKREAREGYLFISPWIVGFALFLGGPIIAVFFISLTDWSMFGSPNFIGLANYQNLLNDHLFWKSIKVTLIYLLNLPINLVLGLFLAILLNQQIRARGFFRTIYYIPSVTAGVAVAILWSFLFNYRFGFINAILREFGIPGPAWLISEIWVLPAFIAMSIWSVGGPMLIYLGGLQAIPTSLYEAAIIDGANFWYKFRYITLPLTTPVILFNAIIGIVYSFQVFTPAYVMTQGGPNYGSMFYVLLIYFNTFEWYRLGYASALAAVLFFIILIFTYILLKSSASWVYYAARR